ncbi:hypothetical protein [Methylocaldum sp. GT1BB]|jgi:hypothetical protein|uniref:hypothetical protein n=1 Tax=Methylocaldum sp. GT1BB TaxID=3438963 RepID=UPI003DA0DB0D
MAKKTSAHSRQCASRKIIRFPGTSTEFDTGRSAERVVCEESRELMEELQELVESGDIEGLVVVATLRNGYELTKMSGSAHTKPFRIVL